MQFDLDRSIDTMRQGVVDDESPGNPGRPTRCGAILRAALLSAMLAVTVAAHGRPAAILLCDKVFALRHLGVKAGAGLLAC